MIAILRSALDFATIIDLNKGVEPLGWPVEPVPWLPVTSQGSILRWSSELVQRVSGGLLDDAI